MNGNYSQVQLHKELKEVVVKLNKLEAEIKLIVQKMQKQEMIPGLDKGLKELKEGRGKTYKSVKEWAAAMNDK
jgi:hypothetical protein